MEQSSTPQNTPIRSILKEINTNEMIANKSSANVQPAVKSLLTLESDISETTIDNTLSSGFDSPLNSSYQIPISNVSLGDLLSGFDGLKFDTPKHDSNRKNQDANNSMSSDEEMFQECESGFDLDTTAVNSGSTSVQAHSSNIDHNVFDKTINYSTIVANSTAGLPASTSTDLSELTEKSDILFKTSDFDQTQTVNESLLNPYVNSNSQSNVITEHIQEMSNDELENSVQEQTANFMGESIKIDMADSQAAEKPVVEFVVDRLIANVDINQDLLAVDKDATPIEETQHVDEKSTGSIVNVTQDIELVDNAKKMNTSVNFNETESEFSPDLTLLESVALANKLKIEKEQMSPKVAENPIVTIDSKAMEKDLEAPLNNVQSEVHPDNAIEKAITINVTADFANECVELNTTETQSVHSNPSDSIPCTDELVSHTVASNQTFEAMDVDMNGTLNLTQPTIDTMPNQLLRPEPFSNQTVSTPQSMSTMKNVKCFVECESPINKSKMNTSAANRTFEPQLNQTTEMTECVPIDCGAQEMNVTVDMPKENFDQNPSNTETASPAEPDAQPQNQTMPWDVTQDLNDVPKSTAELNQTIDLPNATENVLSPLALVNINGRFAKYDSATGLNVTHNLSKDFLLSSRRSIEANPTSTNNVNLNETIVVDNKLPSMNTSYIIAPKSVEIPPNSNAVDKKLVASQSHDQFKLPAVPPCASNPSESKYKSESFDAFDDEFQSPGLILNPNDFDFLLSKGNSAGHTIPRDSILERFDPILGRKSIVPPVLINRLEASATVATTTANAAATTSIIVPHIISTIKESSLPIIVAANDQLNSIKQLPATNQCASINERNKGSNKSNNNISTIVKLASAEKTDCSNSISISGDGDNSQASSTTETYETASIGEPLKADVTMSVGLIHDLKMDNMKSLEQDKVESNLKMNDEHKVKQEMIGDIERKLKEAEAREEALLRRITEKEKALNKMGSVVENYEKTMVDMISEHAQTTQNYEKQLIQLKSERDANFHHLTSLENTFSDLHVKYEKSKQMAVEVKESEAKLVEKLEFCQTQMKLQEQRYDKLKNHALSQLEGANAKLEALNRAHTNESKKLTAQLKKEEISRQSIMEQLAQKTKENAELVKICDELINNGGDAS